MRESAFFAENSFALRLYVPALKIKQFGVQTSQISDGCWNEAAISNNCNLRQMRWILAPETICW